MRRWFLPKSADLLGLLARQGEVTIKGMDALAAWSKGDLLQGTAVRQGEHLADAARREVLKALKDAFVTPISPEDIYEISERLDAVLNAAKNLVRESELLAMGPDPAMAEMADLVALGVRHLVEGIPSLASDPGSGDCMRRRVDPAAARHRARLPPGHVSPPRHGGPPRGDRATRAVSTLRPDGRSHGGSGPSGLVRGGEGELSSCAQL